MSANKRICNLFGSVFLVLTLGATFAASAQTSGHYVGDLVIKHLNDNDGRVFEVIKNFTYIDPTGGHWGVPKGARSDCASVPRVAWSIFPPCAGSHLKAAVVHDHFCETRNKSWRDVHRMFFNALRAAGVSQRSASLMYAAVYMFGPRWLPGGGPIRGRLLPPQSKQREKLEAMQSWIKANNPSLEQIETRAREAS